MQDMPAIASSTYASTPVNLVTAMGHPGNWIDQGQAWQGSDNNELARIKFQAIRGNQLSQQINSGQELEQMTTRRLVQVFIADPNENVPLDQALLYTGEQKFTDATDQELFFEIDINTILKSYNEKRVKFIDKKVKERTEYLEPAKIRDLKMVVVNIASF